MQDLEKFKNEMNLSGKNVYVGHRYGPVLDDTGWDNTKEYEPLTIIQYQGDSYVSRTYVPKGIDINNKDYWYSIGVYNAQVASYRQRVDDVEAGFNTIKTNVTENTNEIGDINTTITDFILNVNQSRVNVLDFGLVNDGETDNTPLLNDLLTFVKSNNLTSLYFPKGHYYFSETITIDINNVSIVGAGRRNTYLNFPIGVDGLTFKSGVYSPLVKGLKITTTKPNQPEIIENWSDNAGLKFSTISNENAASEVNIENVTVTNFFKGMTFRDYVWQSNFKEVRLDTCGYSIYQDDAFSHTSMQNIFEHVYSNNPYFGGLRISNMQAEFINLNMGSDKETAYLIDIENNSNLLFTVPNFEDVYVNVNRKEAIMIKDFSNVTILNPSFKDLKTTDSTELAWVGVYNNALVNIQNHKFYQTGSYRLGNIYNRGMVNGQLDVGLTPLWFLVKGEDGRYQQRLHISKEKSAVSNNIVLSENKNPSYREYLFQPTNRGRITGIKAIYISPHASGYGELEVYQLLNGSKNKLANLAIRSTESVNKFDEVNLNVQISKFESYSPVYVGGFGLGTLQVVVTYEE